MASPKKTVVYSTDPDPLPASPQKSAPPSGATNPAAPFAIQGSNPVRVQRERKGRKGKTVCIITGVLSPAAGKQALLKYLKSQMGAGGVIRDDTLEIQGDQRDRILELLTGLGYKAKAAGG